MCEFGGNIQKLCKNNTCEICFNKSIASYPKSKYWSLKNEKTPREVFKKTDKKYLFDCSECNHEFSISMDNLTLKNQWCGYCSSQKLCYNDECKICFEKSFASHPRSKYWSKNNDKTAREIYKNTNSKYLFDCNICNHTFQKEISKITNDNSWCQYCSHQKLCDDNDCSQCFENCFESHPKAKYWSKRNTKHPGDVFKKSGTKYWFDCHKCGHDYEKILCDMDRYDCPYCGCNILCDKEECKICFEKSFASSNKAKYFSDSNNINPRTIFKASEKKYEFICEKGHKFSTGLNKITCDNNWCSLCVNKTEGKLFEWLQTNFTNIERQKKFEWCHSKRSLPFDFFLPEFNILIELDGNQHFEQTSNWQSPEKTKEIDDYKTKLVLENGYSIIRILQTDVWNNSNEWEKKLLDNIKKYKDPIQINIGNKYIDGV